MNRFTLVVVLSFGLFQCSLCVLRKWVGNHPEGLKFINDHSLQCPGLIFPSEFDPVVFLDTKLVSRLILPVTGQIGLKESSRIVFIEDSTKCESLQVPTPGIASDGNNWIPPNEINRAVPLTDQIPCQWDDLDISGDILGLKNLHLSVKSLNFFGQQLRNGEYQYLKRSLIGRLALSNFEVLINPKSNCTQQTCPCQDFGPNIFFCFNLVQWKLQQQGGPLLEQGGPSLEDEDEFCEEPIDIDGFCRKICGAKLFTRSPLDKLLQFVDNYKDYIDVHASVFFHKNTLVLVDKDKESGGAEVQNLVKEIKEAFKDQITRRQLGIRSSGKPKINGRHFRKALSVIWWTFLVNVCMFVILYLVYERNPRNNRTFEPFVFARFDNIEDTVTLDSGGIDNIRISTNLENEHSRSFDNPLFGQDIEDVASLDAVVEAIEDEEEEEEGVSSTNVGVFDEDLLAKPTAAADADDAEAQLQDT